MAVHVTMVDDGRKALSLIRENIAKCRCKDEVTVVKRDATRLADGTPHDLIFLDPPYGKGMGEKALASAMWSCHIRCSDRVSERVRVWS